MAYGSSDEETAANTEAVLVKDGIIKEVGSLEDVKVAAGKNAKMADLDGKCLMPSFIDPHSHFIANGQLSLCADLRSCNSFDDIKDTLFEYIKENKIKKGQAVYGFGYDNNFLLENSHPIKTVLDKVSKEIPILIMHVSLHIACANSAALDIAGIDSNTQNPEDGVIGRMEGTNEPNGYLEEGGMQIVQKALMPMFKVKPLSMMKKMQLDYIKNGITTVQDGLTTEAEMKALKMLMTVKALKVDVVAYPFMPQGGVKLLKENEDLCGNYKNHVKIGGYKLILDGSPQGRSAWMSEPYLGGEKDYCGYPWLKDEELYEYLKTAVIDGQQVLVHCNGDAASEQFIRNYEKVYKGTGLRPVMIHCQTVRNDQLDRMAKMNMIASVFIGHVFYWGDIHVKNFGEKRGNHISPARDILDRNIHMNFHQDTPVTVPNMLHSIWCAINRISRGGNVIGEDQKISVYEALRAATIEGAYQYHEEDSKGTIEKGKRADLVILDKSPLEVDKMEIKDINVLETIKDGKTIFKS